MPLCSGGGVPVVTILSGGSNNPLLYLFFWGVGGCAGIAIYFFFNKRYIFRDGNFKRIAGKFYRLDLAFEEDSEPEHWKNGKLSVFRIFRERSILSPIKGLTFLLYAWGAVYLNDNIAAVLLETWPIFFILLIAKLQPDEYELTRRTAFLNIFSILAVAVVVFSDLSPKGDIVFGIEIFYGTALILGSIVFNLQDATQLKQAKAVSDPDKEILVLPKELEEGFKDPKQRWKERVETGSVVLLHGFSLAISTVIALSIFILFEIFNIFQNFSGSISLPGILILILAGALYNGIGSIFIAKGTIIAKDLAAQTVRYLTPAFGLLYILAFSPLKNTSLSVAANFQAISSINVRWLIAGALGVMSIGILTLFKGEIQKLGLTAFIISLWLSGLLVLFRDEWQWWKDSISSFSNAGIGYFSFIAISATIFALLFGFEALRVNQYIEKEEKLVFSLLRRLELMFPNEKDQLVADNDFEIHRSGHKGEPEECRTILDCVEKIDTTTNQKELEGLYNLVITKLKDKDTLSDNQSQDLNSSASTEYSEINLELNLLAHSKQGGRGAAAPVAIIILGAFTMGLSFSLRPPMISGIGAILVDMFAFLLPATIAYLIFYTFDLHYGRRASIVEREAGTSIYKVEFASSGEKGETFAAVLLITSIVVVYAFLFSVKWLALA